MYLFEDGTRIILTGSRGNVDFVGEVGGRLMGQFTYQGHFSGPADVAIPAPTYDSTIPPILINGNFTIGAFGAIIQQLAVGTGIGTRAVFSFFIFRFDLGVPLRSPFAIQGSNWLPGNSGISGRDLTYNIAIGYPF